MASAVRDVSPELRLVASAGAGGTVMRTTAEEARLAAVNEAFPDRAYPASGELAPRTGPGAALHDPLVAARRSVRMAVEGRIETTAGGAVDLQAGALCLPETATYRWRLPQPSAPRSASRACLVSPF